jgi:mono/diheme cytochrome c family protein
VLIASITTTGKIGLLAVAGTFIAFSLIVAMVVPKRRPEFPGSRLRLFILVTAALFAAQLATVWWVAETQEVEAAEHGEPAETEPVETQAAETEPAETEPAETGTENVETETEPAETGPGETETAPGGGGDATAGKAVFASAGCSGCHTLAAAGSSGNVGPNLDAAKPSFDKVVERVTNGKGVMPSFKGQLSEQQILDVAAFVSESTRGS